MIFRFVKRPGCFPTVYKRRQWCIFLRKLQCHRPVSSRRLFRYWLCVRGSEFQSIIFYVSVCVCIFPLFVIRWNCSQVVIIFHIGCHKDSITCAFTISSSFFSPCAMHNFIIFSILCLSSLWVILWSHTGIKWQISFFTKWIILS